MTRELTPTVERTWCEGIKADFEEGRIVTERELQCCLYYHLRKELTGTGLRLFIEPSIRSEDRRIPDMVIAMPDAEIPGAHRVLLFLELKVSNYPKFQGELERIGTRGPGTSFTITRRSLDGRNVAMTLVSDKSTRFALGFIGSSDAKAVYANEMLANVEGAFVERHPELAARTMLLYGRIHVDGTTAFGVEPLGRLTSERP